MKPHIANQIKRLRLLEAKARVTEFREVPNREPARELTPQERSRRRIWAVAGGAAAIGTGIWAANKISNVRRSTPKGTYPEGTRIFDGTIIESAARTAERQAADKLRRLQQKIRGDAGKQKLKLKQKAEYDAEMKRMRERGENLSDRRPATEFARGDQLLRGMLTRSDGSKVVRTGPLAHAAYVGGRGYELQPWEEAAARRKYGSFARVATPGHPRPSISLWNHAVRDQLAKTARDGRQWQRASLRQAGFSAKPSRLVQLHRNVLRATVEFNLRGVDGTFLPSLDPISNYRKGRRMVTSARRTSDAAGDISDVIAGRPREPGKKRFWEKAWFHNALLGAAAGGTILGLKHYTRATGRPAFG